MYVGMNRQAAGERLSRVGVPHVRGDEPSPPEEEAAHEMRSPCTWG